MAMIQHIILVLLLQFAYLKSIEVKQPLSSVTFTNGSHSCPRPTVGNCSCKWTGPYADVKCVGLQTVPEKLPKNTLYITFIRGTIKEIPQEYFLQLKKLYNLDLGYNQISNKFYLPKTLTTLQLNYNNLNASNIFGMFNGLTRLRSIDVSNNPLGEKLVPGTFSGSKNVNKLAMADCSLEDLGESAFSELINLRLLTLHFNQIRTLKKGAFRGISCPKGETSLRLKIHYNRISHIEDGTFEDVRGVSQLYLDGNELTSVPDLTGLSDVAYMRFQHNRIENISAFTQFKTRHIGELNLAHNNIKELPSRFLDGYSKLNMLMLNDNQIEKMHKDSFKGLQNLQDLYLFNNNITQLPDGVFANLTLKNLFLNGNRMKVLTGRPFKGMKKAKTAIYLFGNDLQHIDDDFFNDLGNETKVDVRCRSLKDLPHIQRSSLSRVNCAPNQLGWIRKLGNQAADSLSDSGFHCKQTTANNWDCIPCKVGSFQTADRDNQPCIECSAGGFYQDEMAKTTCKECNIGTYVHPKNTPGTTALSCQACPQGTQTSEKAGYRACKCLPSFYRFDRFGRCFPCPSNAFKCEKDYASLSPGFYWRWENSTFEKQYRDFIANLEIKNPEFAKGIWKFEGTLPNPYKCPRDSCLGGLNSNCKTGYQGPLCALCEQNYFNKINRCIRCPSKFWAGFKVAIVILLFVGILLALLWGDRKKLKNENNRTIADKILSCFKIVIGFYQVMAGVYSAFSNITWPSSVIWMQKTLHFIQLNVLQIAPLSCITPRLSFNVLQQFGIIIGLNITVVAFILIYLMIRIAILKRKKSYSQSEIDESVTKTKSSCIRNICVFLFATYPKTCTCIIQILSINCVQLCFDKVHAHCDSYLRSDLSVQCHTPQHNIYSSAATAFLIYPIGFPMVILILVWKYIHQPSKRNDFEESRLLESPCANTNHSTNNENVQEPENGESPCTNTNHSTNNENVQEPENVESPCAINSENDDEPATLIEESPFKSGLSLFSENYRPNCWYWEALEMIRKLVLISGLTLIGEHSRTQIGLGAIISAVFAILYVYKRPITNKFENLLQTVALMAIFLNLGIGVMLKTSDSQKMSPIVNKHSDKLGVSIMMIIINVAVIGIVTVAVLKVVIMQTLKCCRSANEGDCRCGHCCKTCLKCCLSLLLPFKMGSSNVIHDDESRAALLQSARNV